MFFINIPRAQITFSFFLQGEHLEENQLDWDFKCPGNLTTSEDRCGGFKRSGLLATENCKVPYMFFCEKPASGTFKTRNALRNLPKQQEDYLNIPDFS